MTDPGFPVLWIDPGMMTGLALWNPRVPDQQGWLWCDEFAFIPAGDMIEELVRYFCPNLRIGWERFRVGAKTPGDDAHHAIEMIGVARRAALKVPCTILTPASPADRKKATMGMLKHLGWWVPGKDDAQSAAQHLLSWMMRNNSLPSGVEVELARYREKMA